MAPRSPEPSISPASSLDTHVTQFLKDCSLMMRSRRGILRTSVAAAIGVGGLGAIGAAALKGESAHEKSTPAQPRQLKFVIMWLRRLRSSGGGRLRPGAGVGVSNLDHRRMCSGSGAGFGRTKARRSHRSSGQRRGRGSMLWTRRRSFPEGPRLW
jgi:hypothetical protein